jgi:hypothetical protein
VSDSALSAAFFDPARQVHGLARAGATLLFEGSHSLVLDEPARLEPSGDAWEASIGNRFEVRLEPASEPVELAGNRVRVCTVSGSVAGTPVDGLGTVSETLRAPAWAELEALRAISVLADPGHAVLAVSRRPRGAPGHGEELVSAALIAGGEVKSVEEARISTVYDGEGRQRNAGLELWLPEEDFPRRASGSVTAGSSLELEGLDVHAAVFSWRLEGQEAVGQYELAVRATAPDAA